MLTDALILYNLPDKKSACSLPFLLIHFIQANIDCPNSYLVQLIGFDYDKVGNLGNLSRINPALLGIKDVRKSIKNSIYLFGQFAKPLLCFLVIMVMGDNHEDGLEFGSETGWIVKSVPGMLPSLELERLVSLLGLAFQLPYVPDDSSCRDMDILYVSMYKKAFNFSTVMIPAVGEGIFAYSILHQFLHFVADVKKAAAEASGSKTVTSSKMATSSKLVLKLCNRVTISVCTLISHNRV